MRSPLSLLQTKEAQLPQPFHFDSGDLKPSCQTEDLFSQSKVKNSSGRGMGLDFFNCGNCAWAVLAKQ